MSALLDTGQIAARLELSREYVTDKLVKRPDFPKPHLKVNRKVRKWLADDIEAWRKRTAKA
jgi:predicted DNA-binding transcriptional regulator AlpA